MKRTLILATSMIWAALIAPGQRTPDSMLGAAVHQEEIEGDLKGAIAAYQRVLAAPGVGRKTAAEALLRIGQCYEGLGNAESRKAYERVVRDYPDQKAAVAQARAKLGARQPAAGPISRMLWSGPAIIQGNLSADGRYFPFTDTRQSDLFVHDMVTGVDRNLTNNPKGSSAHVCCPIISPDGTRIGYSWNDLRTGRGAELRTLSVNSDSTERTLYANPDISSAEILDWSPDGRSIGVQVTRIDHSAQLGILSFPNGSLRVIKSIDWRSNAHMYFSPDGKYLAYHLWQYNDPAPGHDIFITSIDGTREIKAVTHPAKNRPVGWSPDGKWFLFTSDRGVTADLWAVAFANGNVQGSPRMLRGSVENFFPRGWSSTGGLYYMSRQGGSVNRVHVASLDFITGSFTSAPVNDPAETGIEPAWSPDGKQLAYQSSSPGVSAAIAVRSNDTGVVRQLRPRKLDGFHIRNWSPDGRSVLVDGQDLNGRLGVYRVDAESGDVSATFQFERNGADFFGGDFAWMPDRRFMLIRGNGVKGGVYRVDTQTGDLTALFVNAPGQVSGDLNVSPDGKRIFFNRRFQATGQTAIIERDLMSGAERELIRGPVMAPPKLSPDGQYLATSTADTASNTRRIMAVPTAGGEPRELMQVSSELRPEDPVDRNLGQWMWPRAWTPDSQAVLARKRPADKTKDGELWLLPLNGASPKKIGSISEAVDSPVVSPDGRHLAYILTESIAPLTVELSVLENFLPKGATKK